MKVKITVSYEIDNLIDKETLNKVYQNDLLKCVKEAIESEIKKVHDGCGNYQKDEYEYGKLSTLNNLKSVVKEIDYKPNVIDSAFVDVFDKASCIQHWHNTGKNDEGMVVSSQHVHELWDVLEKYKSFRHSL